MKVSEIKVSYYPKKTSKIKMSSSAIIYSMMIEQWNKNTIQLQEEVKVVLLNRANHLIGIYELSKGGISSTIIDIKLVLSVALKCVASGIVLVHNHPSGNLVPSESDITVTKRIKKACSYVDITLLDHLIISNEGYYSFSDDGKL